MPKTISGSPNGAYGSFFASGSRSDRRLQIRETLAHDGYELDGRFGADHHVPLLFGRHRFRKQKPSPDLGTRARGATRSCRRIATSASASPTRERPFNGGLPAAATR